MNHSSYGGSGIGSGSSGNDSQFNHNLNYQFKNNEAYGSVNTQTLRKRRTTTSKASSKSKTTLQRKNKHSLKPNSKPTNCSLYRYNYQIFILVLPCLLSIFLPPNNNNNNNVLLILTLYSVLILYIFDLANWKDGFHITIWITLFVLFCFLCWDSFWSYGNDFGSYRSILNGNSNGNNGGYDEYWEMESWSTFLLSIWNWTAKVLFFYCLVSDK